jgi:hypothetical protein
MREELLRWDPDYRAVLETPIPMEEFPESSYCAAVDAAAMSRARAFVAEYDASMRGEFATLVDWSPGGERTLADSVREVLGRTSAELEDDEAVALAMDPARNRILGESLNLTTHAKLCRPMHHPHYTFRKRMSHTADSQDQRHRMTPASRPVLSAHYTGRPDYIRPPLVDLDSECRDLYDRTMKKAWEGINRLLAEGAAPEEALYLLPNAVRVRFTESSDLLNLHHKHTMRLCYNAQEEIWRASREEALQIREVHPRIGAFLLPPCGRRDLAGARPICPEGTRYCGVTVWKFDIEDYRRVL